MHRVWSNGRASDWRSRSHYHVTTMGNYSHTRQVTWTMYNTEQDWYNHTKASELLVRSRQRMRVRYSGSHRTGGRSQPTKLGQLRSTPAFNRNLKTFFVYCCLSPETELRSHYVSVTRPREVYCTRRTRSSVYISLYCCALTNPAAGYRTKTQTSLGLQTNSC